MLLSRRLAVSLQPRRRRHQFSLILSLLLLLVVIATTTTTTTKANNSNVGMLLWLSDIHYDPYYGQLQATQHEEAAGSADCTTASSTAGDYLLFGKVGCDTPRALIASALQHAKSLLLEDEEQLQKGFDAVLMTGDTARHQTDLLLPNPINQTRTILSDVANMLRSVFDDDANDITTVSIIPSVGNNDVTPDYYLDLEEHQQDDIETTDGGGLAMVYNGWHTMFESSQEKDSFTKGGYIARNISSTSSAPTSPPLLILSINTLLYSSYHQPTPSEFIPDPFDQFQWLERQLLDAASSRCRSNQFVYIIGHIAPTIGSYRHTQLWQSQYLRTYYSIVSKYQHIIKGQFFGHLHTDEFRVIIDDNNNRGTTSNNNSTTATTSNTTSNNTASTTAIPLYMSSSITPIYGSNPSFRIVYYDLTTKNVLDYDTYYLDLNNINKNDTSNNVTWQKSLSFTEDFHVPDLSLSSLNAILKQLQDGNESTWGTLLSRQSVHSTVAQSCDASCRLDWICTLQVMSTDEYESCLIQNENNNNELPNPLDRASSGSSSTRTVIYAVFVSLLLIGCILLLISFRKRRMQRRHYHTPQQEHHGHGDDEHHHQNNVEEENHHGDPPYLPQHGGDLEVAEGNSNMVVDTTTSSNNNHNGIT